MIARAFSRLVDAVELHARSVLALWLLAAVGLTLVAPSLNDVGSTDTADFLPADAPSQRADRVLAHLFPDDPTRGSSIVVLARDGGLTDADRAYIGELTAALTAGALAEDVTGVQSTATSPELAPFLRAPDGEAELLVASMAHAPVSTAGTAAVGRLRDQPVTEAPATTPPTAPASPPPTPPAPPVPSTATTPGARIAVPAQGTWTYRATGGQQIGLSRSNIDEESSTTVTRTGGPDDAPELRVRTETSSYTRDDTRRHTPAGVELLATTFSAGGATFGGPLDPPQLLARTPLQVGATWSGRSTADGMTIDATARITRERDVTVPAGTFHCWEIQIDATISGDIDGEQHDTSCWVPDLGLPVITDQAMNGTYSGIDFRIDLHLELTATP